MMTTIQNNTSNFSAQYETLLLNRPAKMPMIRLDDLTVAIEDYIRADNDPETGEIDGCHVLGFGNFESFFSWWNAAAPHARMIEDTFVNTYKAMLEVAYNLLVAESKALALAKGVCVGAPEETLALLERLKVMHPDLYWGTIPLGDYHQFAGIEAPEYIIVFANEFGPNREECPDPYADICGVECDPSIWRLSDEAARLLRKHNKVSLATSPHD